MKTSHSPRKQCSIPRTKGGSPSPASTSVADVDEFGRGIPVDDRLTRLDLRLAKRFSLSNTMKLQGNVNIYNMFNGSASSTLNTNYGPLWLQPSLLQDGRMLQFSASLTF